MLKAMKKEYMKPDMRVIEIKHRCHILTVSDRKTVTAVKGNVFDEVVESDDKYDGVVR